MSGGRVELGLGAGWYDGEHAAYGIPFPPTGERFEMLEEQLEIVTGLWATPAGEHVLVRRRRTTRSSTRPRCPKPVQQPRPPIILGGWGTKRTPAPRGPVRRRVQHAVPAGRSYFREGCDHVRAACEAIGRDPASMRYTVALVVCVGDERGRVRTARRRRSARSPTSCAPTRAGGTPAEVVERIREFETAGAETVYLQVPRRSTTSITSQLHRGRGAAARRGGSTMDVQFGVHTGLQHTSIAELRDALGAHRGARLRLDLDLGPLLRGRRHRRPALPRGDHRAHRARGDDRRVSRAARSCTRPATATPRCSPTRWRRSTRSPTAASCSASAAVGSQNEYDAYGLHYGSPGRTAAHARRVHPVRARPAHAGPHDVRRRVLHARTTRSASRSRCRRGCRSGSAAAARR